MIMPTVTKKESCRKHIGGTFSQKVLKLSVDEMEVEGTLINFRVVHGFVDMDCCSNTVRTHELMACRKGNASIFHLSMQMEHKVCPKMAK